MCTMKKKFQMIGFALSVLLVTLPVATVGADNAASGKQKKEKTTESALGVKPVTGSWINLAYKDVRNKYTNPHADNCPDNHHMLSVPVKNKYRISIPENEYNQPSL